jgi:uncharacterized OB-fold protein
MPLLGSRRAGQYRELVALEANVGLESNLRETDVQRVPLKHGLLTTVDDSLDARLVGGRCRLCSRISFPVQELCPYCSADGSEPTPLSPDGVIEVCTTVLTRPPGYEGAVPFGFGVVELPEGIRIISRIRHPERCTAGTAMRLVLDTLHTDADGREVVTYAFEPIKR